MRKRLLLINSGTIVAVVFVPEDQGGVTKEDYRGSFDTVVRDDKALFSEGEVYSSTVFSDREYKTLTIEEKREKMSVSKEQAEVSLIIYGLYDDVNSVVSMSGSRALNIYWNRPGGVNFSRNCPETIELVGLLDISPILMDDIFELAMKVNPVDLSSLEPSQIDLISDYFEQARSKKTRSKLLGSMTVEVDGLVFDADPASRQNMADAIIASGTTGIISTVWKLADNTYESISIDQLKSAHAKAIMSVGELIVPAGDKAS